MGPSTLFLQDCFRPLHLLVRVSEPKGKVVMSQFKII